MGAGIVEERVEERGEERGGGPALAWRTWPAAERPAQAAAVGLAILAATFGLGAWGRDAVLGGAAFAILFLSLSAYFLPTRYRIDGDGVEVATAFGRTSRPWSGLATYVADARGVTLSPYRRASWLETYRGVRLLFHRNRDDVLGAVAVRLGERRAR